MILFKNDINKKGSQTWLLCNDNSKSQYFRNKFISENGGKFVKNRYWEWIVEKTEEEIKQEIIDNSKKFWIFNDASGKEYVVDNLTDFCNKHSLARQKMYDLMSGKRKTHKGFTFVSKVDNEIKDPA